MFEFEFPCQADPELFFPVAEEGSVAFARQAALAVAVCADCPFRADCRAFAVASGQEFGVWGGSLPSERRAERAALVAVV
jgi:WhiB family redox-sensing transcriptional regulator